MAAVLPDDLPAHRRAYQRAQGGQAEGLDRRIAKLAAGLAAISIVAYQSWFMPYFQTFFAGREGLARLVFYTLYGSILLVSGTVLATRPELRRKLLPFAVAAALALLPVMLHPIGLVTRAYIIAVLLGGATVVLLLGSAPLALLRLSASVTALYAVICLSDLLCPEGYSLVSGRAAGLALNANLAGAALLLGAAATYRSIPDRLRPCFFVLIGAAVFATLSRSTLLTAIAALGIPVALAAWRSRRAPGTFRFGAPTGWRPAALLGAALLAWIGLALALNGQFRSALFASEGDLLSVGAAIHAAQDAVSASIERQLSGTAGASAGATDAAKITALGERLVGEGQRNTISARLLALERALLYYRDSGFFGSGLETAQSLAPHNSFVLFALAFGHLGWLIPIALIGFVFFRVRDRGDLPLGIVALGTMLTGHDILLNPSLFLPLALGIAGMIAGREESAATTYRSIACGAALGAALFVAGCFAIVYWSPSLAVESLRIEDMRTTGPAYADTLQPVAFAGIFQSASGTESGRQPYLTEDSRPLVRDDVRSSTHFVPEAGHYVILGPAALLFAASDGSDPRQNGRAYEFGRPLAISPLFYVLLGAVAIWSAATVLTLWRAARSAP